MTDLFTPIPACRMKNCNGAASRGGICDPHAQKLSDRYWVPVWPVVASYVHDRSVYSEDLLCGFCGASLWYLEKFSGAATATPERFLIERWSHPDGKLLVGPGHGFQVATDRQIEVETAEGVPLYRAHAPVCPSRPTLETT